MSTPGYEALMAELDAIRDGRPERPKVRGANAPLLPATHALDDCPCPTCKALEAERGDS